VNGERVIDDLAKEVLRKQLWQVADFCGVQILTHAILSYHFHVLLKVPLKTLPSDQELLRRYQLLHPKPTKYQTERLDVIKGQLKNGSPEGETWRKRQLMLIGDVSAFMKFVKQRFATPTVWITPMTDSVAAWKNSPTPTTAFPDRYISCTMAGV